MARTVFTEQWLAEYRAKRARESGPSSNTTPTIATPRPASKPARKNSAAPATGESLEGKLAADLALLGLEPIREYHMANIDPTARGWRFDFAFPDVRLLIEIHGALGRGKHSRRAGQTNDMQKANAATERGWSVLSYGAAEVRSGEAGLQVERCVVARRRALAGGARLLELELAGE